MDIEDTEACYRAVKSRDRRFDGVFYTGVTSTGIYCRPSCPAITPAKKQRHLPPHRGRRAGRRVPGLQALPAGRDARLAGLGRRRRRGRAGDAADRRRRRRARRGRRARRAGRLHAAPPAAAARHASSAPARSPSPAPAARRTPASSSRPRRCRSPTSPSRPASPASGSSTTRSARSTPARPPSCAAGPGTPCPTTGRLELRLPVRAPYAGSRGAAVPRRPPGAGRRGERAGLVRPHADPAARCRPRAAGLPAPTSRRRARRSWRCELAVEDLRDVGAAVERCRRLLDADCDPLAVADELCDDPRMAALVRQRPGLRVPGQRRRCRARDPGGARPAGVARRRDLARRQARRAVRRAGTPVDVRLARRGCSRRPRCSPRSTRRSCRCRGPADVPWSGSAGRWPTATCRSTAASTGPRCGAGCSRCPGSGRGPPTTSRCARSATPTCSCRPTSASVGALASLGEDPARAAELAERWRPWRSYALMHLWVDLDLGPTLTVRRRTTCGPRSSRPSGPLR